MSNPLPDPEATLQRAKEWLRRQHTRKFDSSKLEQDADYVIKDLLALLAVRTQERDALKVDTEDDSALLNTLAEALGISDGSGEWDRTELLETARVCNADDVQVMRQALVHAESALLTCQCERDEARHLCNAEYLRGVAAGQELTKPMTGFPGVSSV